MKKVSTRRTSIVWVNEKSQLKVLPILQSIENENEQFFWSHPEEFLYVHDDAVCTKGDEKCILHCEDQELTVECEKIKRFRGDIETAVCTELISEEKYIQRITPIQADVCIIFADPEVRPEYMSWFFDLQFVMAEDFDDQCPSCVMHLDQARKIVGFLNEAVFIKKDVNINLTNFLQRNMKRAIFISESSKGSVLKWFVDTFRITFERAHIAKIILHDIETGDQYISALNEG